MDTAATALSTLAYHSLFISKISSVYGTRQSWTGPLEGLGWVNGENLVHERWLKHAKDTEQEVIKMRFWQPLLKGAGHKGAGVRLVFGLCCALMAPITDVWFQHRRCSDQRRHMEVPPRTAHTALQPWWVDDCTAGVICKPESPQKRPEGLVCREWPRQSKVITRQEATEVATALTG